ncbi:molybdate ABC transporter substrate-binding protein [Egicoccus halophilus]|uniref:Molybdate-binding protein n=1 Tax=Egicoccus halophilus TaxID=1670830 RepID=A0A8J3EQU4_9ACTN|nr:molybdate ABC transporter substrate-binding protein [Egicoccus halophilus]GGI03383.1 molybdate-binding protein [Egicoccus halophilus]
MRVLVAWLAALALLSACNAGVTSPTAGEPDTTDTDGAVGSEPLTGELVVFVAASLTDAFEELAGRLEARHPDLTVTTNLAGSQTLAAQLVEGAPADVFASASGAALDLVEDTGRVAAREPFAANRLAIVVEPGNPHGITGLADLAHDDLVLVLPGPQVPAGQYAAQALERAGVEVTPASLELDVRAALGKVRLGEADAAIVYASDVVAAGDGVERVVIPDGANVVATYPVARLLDAPNPAAADAFVSLLRSQDGQAVLRRHGFEAP